MYQMVKRCFPSRDNDTMEVKANICRALDCTLNDIVDISEEDK